MSPATCAEMLNSYGILSYTLSTGLSLVQMPTRWQAAESLACIADREDCVDGEDVNARGRILSVGHAHSRRAELEALGWSPCSLATDERLT